MNTSKVYALTHMGMPTKLYASESDASNAAANRNQMDGTENWDVTPFEITPAQISADVALKACPFCGGEAASAKVNSWFVLECLQCGVGVGSDDGVGLSDIWNRRAAVSTPATTGEGNDLRVAAKRMVRALQASRHVLVTEQGIADLDAFERLYPEARNAWTGLDLAIAALPPSGGWEAGAEAMQVAATNEAHYCWARSIPLAEVHQRIASLPLPPPPSREG